MELTYKKLIMSKYKVRIICNVISLDNDSFYCNRREPMPSTKLVINNGCFRFREMVLEEKFIEFFKSCTLLRNLCLGKYDEPGMEEGIRDPIGRHVM